MKISRDEVQRYRFVKFLKYWQLVQAISVKSTRMKYFFEVMAEILQSMPSFCEIKLTARASFLKITSHTLQYSPIQVALAHVTNLALYQPISYIILLCGIHKPHNTLASYDDFTVFVNNNS